MKRFGRLVFGGIENKIFNAILVTILVLTAAFIAVYFYHSGVLVQLEDESGRRQQESIEEITGQVMDAKQFDDLTMLCLEYKGPAAREENA